MIDVQLDDEDVLVCVLVTGIEVALLVPKETEYPGLDLQFGKPSLFLKSFHTKNPIRVFVEHILILERISYRQYELNLAAAQARREGGGAITVPKMVIPGGRKPH